MDEWLSIKWERGLVKRPCLSICGHTVQNKRNHNITLINIWDTPVLLWLSTFRFYCDYPHSGFTVTTIHYHNDYLHSSFTVNIYIHSTITMGTYISVLQWLPTFYFTKSPYIPLSQGLHSSSFTLFFLITVTTYIPVLQQLCIFFL